MKTALTFEPIVDDFTGLFTTLTGHFKMERELLVGVVAQRRASPELIEKVVDSMNGKSKKGALFFAGIPMRARTDEQEVARRDMGSARHQLQEVTCDWADGKVGGAIAAPTAEETVGELPRSVSTGPAVVAKPDQRGLHSGGDAILDAPYVAHPSRDVDRGTILCREPEVVLPSGSTETRGVEVTRHRVGGGKRLGEFLRVELLQELLVAGLLDAGRLLSAGGTWGRRVGGGPVKLFGELLPSVPVNPGSLGPRLSSHSSTIDPEPVSQSVADEHVAGQRVREDLL